MQMFAYATLYFCAYVYVGFFIVCNFICKNKLSVEQQAVPRFWFIFNCPAYMWQLFVLFLSFIGFVSFSKNKIHGLIFRPVIGG